MYVCTEAFVLGRAIPKNESAKDLHAGQRGLLSSGVSRSVMAAALAAGSSLLPGAPVAYAQSATNAVLSGQQTTTQAVGGSPIVVTTAPLFGVVTTEGPGVRVIGTGGASLTDANASTITGQTDGIVVNNQSGGLLAITTTGTVTGRTGNGFTALNISGTGITLSAVNATGATDGISATNMGPGVLSITSTGTLTGTNGRGIFADGFGAGVTISAADVTGGAAGIRTRNYGTGVLSVTTTGTVTSMLGRGIDVVGQYTGTDVVVSTAAVSGAQLGISAANRGTGSLSITSTGTVSGGGGAGIYASSSGTGLTIAAAGVTGTTAIDARSYGTGALSVTATGPVTGTVQGIAAYGSSASTGFLISAAAVSGGTGGISAIHNGTGTMSVTTSGMVTGTSGRGTYARNDVAGSDITLNLAGVSGGTDGVIAYQNGSGDLTITTTGGAVNALDGAGIRASNSTSGKNISISTAAVSGTTNGIYAFHNGSEALSITSTGTVTGANGRGIYAWGFSGSTDVSITAMAVNGGTQGIYGRNSGTGALSITTRGTVTGNAGSGISARNDGDATDLTIIATAVTGTGTRAVDARNYGSGALSITTSGAVAGNDGIYAVNYSGTGHTIQTAAVTGAVSGILAYNFGTGALSITSTGAVTGSGTDYRSHGIKAQTQTSTTDLIIATAAVTGGQTGIRASHNGTGALSITSTGTVTGTANRGITAANTSTGTSLSVSAAGASGANFGIHVQNFGSGPLDVTTTGTVSGGQTGISADNLGAGALSIVSTGTVTGTSTRGIYARNGTSGNGLSVSAATVSGGFDGITARLQGTGALSVTATGTVTGTNGDAIRAINTSTGTGITVAAAGVSGGSTGIYARNNGTGALSVTATGSVSASTGTGIIANGYGAGQGVTVEAAAVSGFYHGIYARHNAGAISITATGDITAEQRTGISVQNTYRTTDMTIVATNVSGGQNGISAFHNGTGAAVVRATGAVTGGSFGLSVGNRNGTNTIITAADVTGGYNGIFADHNGSGDLTLTSTGLVTGTSGGGAGIRNTGANATLAFAAVQGTTYGVRATNYGSGALSITATGTVTGTGREGITAQNGYVRRSRPGRKSKGGSAILAGTDLTISTAAVSGGTDGVYALNNGTGALSITATGTITGTSGRGIFAANGGSVITESSYGPDDYDLLLAGPGIASALAPETTQTVTTAGTSLTVLAGTVSGGTDGIYARNFGSGALSITATGPVTGTDGRGIFATNGGTVVFEEATAPDDYGPVGISVASAALTSVTQTATNAGTTLTISAGTVSGGTDGIYARNYGTGTLAITTTGTVTGTADRGIYARNAGTASDIAINTAGVTGATSGIETFNEGTGATSITASGTVTGANGHGIFAQNSATATSLTVNAGSVSGTTNAIEAVNSGTGALAVTASGTVRGGSGAGISTRSNAGSTVTINLLPTTNVSATLGAAIVDGAGNATMTLGAGTVVTGSIALGEGNDTLTIAEGASLAGITTLDGGAGAFTDTLNLNTQFSGAIDSWEIVNANTSSGSITLNGGISGANQFNKSGLGILTISGSNALTGSTLVEAGRLNVVGSIAGSAVTVQNGASLGGTGMTGSLNALSGSTIAPGNSIGTLSVNGNLTLAAGSMLSIEVSPSDADRINVTGTASIAGNLVVIPDAGTYFARSYTLITASSVTGTFAASTFGSLSSAFRTTLVYTGTSVSLRLDPNSLVDISSGTLRGNALAVARSFDTAVAGGYNPQPFFNLYTQGANLSAALGQFSGELHSAERRVALQDSRTVRETAFDRLNDGLIAGAGTAAIAKEDAGNTRTIWMRAAGSWGTAKADGTGSRFTTDQTGFLLGADFARDGFKLGGMFNYLSTDLDSASFGTSRIETIGGALYAGYRQEGSGFAIGTGWAMAHNTAKGSRTISVPGFAQTLRSTVNGTAYQLFGEVAYDLVKAESTRIEPFGRIAYTVLDSKALAEFGGSAALNGSKQSNALTISTFGLRGGFVAGKTTLSGSAGWQRTTGDRATPTAMSLAAVNTPFVVQGIALDRNAAALEALANFSLSARFSLSLGYSGVIGQKNTDHGGRATARLAF